MTTKHNFISVENGYNRRRSTRGPGLRLVLQRRFEISIGACKHSVSANSPSTATRSRHLTLTFCACRTITLVVAHAPPMFSQLAGTRNESSPVFASDSKSKQNSLQRNVMSPRSVATPPATPWLGGTFLLLMDMLVGFIRRL